MDWNAFVEGFKTFWNQPVPIIGFTVGTVILGILAIVGKTSIGKKALNKIKEVNSNLSGQLETANLRLIEAKNDLTTLGNDFDRKYEALGKSANEIIAAKEQEIQELTDGYELKLSVYKEQMLKQEQLLRTICENSVNKKIKEAYESYSLEDLEAPINEIENRIKEQVKAEYEDRLAKLEELIYGKSEAEDVETASE